MDALPRTQTRYAMLRYASVAFLGIRGERGLPCREKKLKNMKAQSTMRKARKKPASNSDVDRLDRIIETARHQLATAGIDGLTMRSLAAESQVSPVTLYNRFGSKDNIVLLVIVENFKKYVDSNRPPSSATANPLDNLLELLRAERGTLKAQPEMSKALVTMYFKPDTKRKLSSHLLGMLRDRFTPILEDMQKSRLLAAPFDLELLSLDIADRFLAVAMKWFQEEFKEKELYDRICFSVLLALGGNSTGPQLKRIHSLLREISRRIEVR